MITDTAMVRRLMIKDWYFFRWMIAGYILLGMLSLFLVSRPGNMAFYVGSTALITVVISMGIHLVVATVVQERSDKTLPFIMSLPVTVMDYTAAKLMANISTFVLPWLTLVIGTVMVIQSRSFLPDGLIPFTVILLGELLVAYCLILAVALISESLAWTIVVMVLCNLFFNFFLFSLARIPEISEAIKSEAVVWSPLIWRFLIAEIAIIGRLLAAIVFFQKRKRDFL
jgi:ABC-type Na+ efflux pump permease subunit